MERTESPLSSILSRLTSGEIETIEEACKVVFHELNPRLPDPEEFPSDPTDFDAGYYEGIVDARDVDRVIIADFCGQSKREYEEKRDMDMH